MKRRINRWQQILLVVAIILIPLSAVVFLLTIAQLASGHVTLSSDKNGQPVNTFTRLVLSLGYLCFAILSVRHLLKPKQKKDGKDQDEFSS